MPKVWGALADLTPSTWQVCNIWYGDRLEGRVREEERELAYVRIGNPVWDEGPKFVNAAIKRRIEGYAPPQASP
ncbi:MAG: hypothetical protein ACREDT_02900 [Methylocella sp.]